MPLSVSRRKRSRIEISDGEHQKRSLVAILYVFRKARPGFLLFRAANASSYSTPSKTVVGSNRPVNFAVGELIEFGLPLYIIEDFNDRYSQADLRIQHCHNDFTLIFHPVHNHGLDAIQTHYEGRVEILDIIDLIAPLPDTTFPKMPPFLLNLLRDVCSTKKLNTELPAISSNEKSYVSQRPSPLWALDYDHHSILPHYKLPQSSQRYVLLQLSRDGQALDLIGSWRIGRRSYGDSLQADLRHLYYQTHGSHHQYIWLSAYHSIILEMSIFTPVTFKSEPRLEWIQVQDLIAYCQGDRYPRKPGRFVNLHGDHLSCQLSNRLYELFHDAQLTTNMLCSVVSSSDPHRIESPIEAPNMALTLTLTALATIAVRSICLSLIP